MSIFSGTAIPFVYPGAPSKAGRCFKVRFTVNNTTDTFDELLTDIGLFEGVCALYIDNGANGTLVNVLVGGTRQTLTVAKNTQGYYQILGSPNSIRLEVTSAGNFNVDVWLINVPVDSFVWPVS